MELNFTTNETWKLFALASLFAWFTIFLFLNQNDTLHVLSPTKHTTSSNNLAKPKLEHPPFSSSKKPKFTVINQTNEKTARKCDIFDGKWVYKPEENSMYDSISCPFIEEKFNCQNNGRPDFNYENWIWEANDCVIPSFNARDMLEKLRNKRVIIVGDSLNRNMWESLSCILYSSLPTSTTQIQAKSQYYKVFKAKDYNCIVEFYWSPFLIELNEKHETGKRVLMMDKVSQNSEQWRGADVMVFNTGFWWTHAGKMRGWDLFEYKGKLTEEMELEIAFERSMKTWATWIKKYVDSKKTRVVFRSISALHNSKPWCYKLTQPLMDDSFQNPFPKSLTTIIERLINNMKKSQLVTYLNITKLSRYRVDAHPSAYRSKKWMLYANESTSFLNSYVDCSHWCLPGLPDTWNRLLYASVFLNY